jgi:APA family basic amino acid/polyamine antiporter
VLVATVNLRGVGESVKLNVVLTIVEITGLMLVIFVGFWAFTGSSAGADAIDFSRVVAFDTAEDKNAFLAVTTATSLAFFAMVGFEDSVNMAEETKDPVKIFPKMLLTGLGIAGVVYIVVAVVAVALVPIGTLEASETPLVEVVKAGAPDLPIEKILPFISMFAVANTALINMLMASRLIYGMAKQHVLPPVLGTVHPSRRTPWVAIVFTTSIAFGLILYVTAFANDKAISTLGGTTSLLLLAVFAVVNIAVLVLRKDVQADSIVKNGTAHFKTPTWLPVVGFVASAYLVLPLSGRPLQQYVLAIALVILGIVLFGVTVAINRAVGIRGPGITDVEKLDAEP